MLKKPRGIGLLSGGLDSALACLVLRDAGAEVECLHFFTGFCVTGHNSRVGRGDRTVRNQALQVAAEVGVPVELVDVAEDYLPVVLRPRFGYGKNMNPCVDCRIFMLARARAYMEETGADFVFTGEVLGQRPKSQTRARLEKIEHEVGLVGRLLRPLSAGLLEPTQVEIDGRVDRGKLLRITGRSRKPQMALAKRYGLSEYMQPAGGCCFLTDEAYSGKLKDVIRHQGPDSLGVQDIFVLGVGRHFRLTPRLKLIVGRDETENNFLAHYSHDHWSIKVSGYAGPTAIVMGEFSDGDVETLASMVARYSDAKDGARVDVCFSRGEKTRVVKAPPASTEVLDRYRV